MKPVLWFSAGVAALSAAVYVTDVLYILASDFALPHLQTWWCHGQFAPPSVNGLSSQQQHPRGMLCLILSVIPHQCSSSEVDSRHSYSHVHTSNLTESVSASL